MVVSDTVISCRVTMVNWQQVINQEFTTFLYDMMTSELILEFTDLWPEKRLESVYAQGEGKSTKTRMRCACRPLYLLESGTLCDVGLMVKHFDTLCSEPTTTNVIIRIQKSNSEHSIDLFFLLHCDLLTLRWWWFLFEEMKYDCSI